MPKYYCEYCGIYLTHSSPGGRKQHGKGKKHIQNKIDYYSQFLQEFQRQALSSNHIYQIQDLCRPRTSNSHTSLSRRIQDHLHSTIKPADESSVRFKAFIDLKYDALYTFRI